MATDVAARIELEKTATPYLQPGEEIALVDGSIAVDFWKGRRGIENAPTPPGVGFVKHQMGVVVTTRRLLMFRMGGVLRDSAQELLTDLPVGQVDSIECIGHSFKSSEVKLTIQGTAYGFIVAHVGQCNAVAKALGAAKQGGASV